MQRMRRMTKREVRFAQWRNVRTVRRSDSSREAARLWNTQSEN